MKEFGNLISEHKENAKATGSTLLIAVLCLGLCAGLIFIFLGEKEFNFNKILFGLSAFFALLGAIGCVQSFVKNRGGRVEIYENGLIAEKGGKRHIAVWNEIAVVKESVEKMYLKGVYVYDRYLYTIETRSGEKFELSNMVSGIAEIGRVLKAKTLENLYPKSLERINNGGQINFDSLSIDKQGLSGIAWTDLASVNVENDLLEVKNRLGETIVNGSYAATPNAHLFVALLNNFISHN